MTSTTHRRQWRRSILLLVLLTALVFPRQMTRGQAPLPAPAPSATPSPTLNLSPASSPASTAAPTLGDKKLTGVVLNDKNEPVAGMTIFLDWRWIQEMKDGSQQITEHTVPAAVTDAQGKFAFSQLLEGDYTYDIQSPAKQYVPVQGAFTFGKADLQKDLRIVVSTGGLVSGRVVDGLTGKPLCGIFVVAGSIPPGGDLAKWGYWQITGSEPTDSQGNYKIRVLPGNTFAGVGRSDNGTVLSKRVCEAVQQVSAAQGQTAAVPDIPVSLHPVIVFAGPDGKPVANAQVRIIPDDLGRGGYILDDSTEAAGTLVLNRFDGGSFQIQQGSLFASGTYHCASGEPLTVTINGRTTGYPSGTAMVQLTEGSAGVVTGKVISEDGAPIPHARVHISEVMRPANSSGDYGVGDYQFSTDKAGVFHAPLDPSGRYFVMIRKDGFNQVQISRMALTIATGATVDLGSIRLARADGFVVGRVIDRAGKPMAGVLVYVQGSQTDTSATVTDDQGHFHIPNVVSGEGLHLKLCLKGEAPDSGEALSQSNDQMDFPDVTASTTEREIVWHPNP